MRRDLAFFAILIGLVAGFANLSAQSRKALSSDDIDAIAMKALTKRVEDRYQSAAEMRLFSLGDAFREAYQGIRARLRSEHARLARSQAFTALIAEIVAFASLGIVMFWMLDRLVLGLATLGEAAMLYQAFSQGQKLMQTLLGSAGGRPELFVLAPRRRGGHAQQERRRRNANELPQFKRSHGRSRSASDLPARRIRARARQSPRLWKEYKRRR